jgi:hypothetical protein
MTSIAANHKELSQFQSLNNTIVPYSTDSIPPYLQTVLKLFKVDYLPTATNSILTSKIQSESMSLFDGLVSKETLKVLWKIIRTQTISYLQGESNEYWHDGYLHLAEKYFDKVFDSKKRKIISHELVCLSELGVIDISKPDINQAKARGFQFIYADTIEAFSKVEIEIESGGNVWVELIKDKPRKRSDISQLADKTIPFGQMNLKSVCEFFIYQIPLADRDGLDQLMAEFAIVINCWLNKTKYDNSTGLLTYPQSFYSPRIGGRVYSESGDQLVRGILKAAWFGIPNVYNYDLVGAHTSIFNRLKPTEFGNNWLKDDGFRQSLADKIGISKELLKRTVIAATYGSELEPNHISKLFKAYKKEFGSIELAKMKLELVKIELSEYLNAVSDWLQEIKLNPKLYQTNAIGLTTQVTKESTLAAHYLQGLEQQAIQWVSSAWNQRRGKFKAISQQHDGLVTIGKIPSNITQALEDKFGLRLIEKAFV